MEKDTRFWQKWWDDKAKDDLSNFELDRGSTLREEKFDSVLNSIYSFCEPRSHERLLDAGCGTGINISRFGPHVNEIIGVDISNEMLKRAKKRIQHENLDNSELIMGSLDCLGFKTDQFDKIICNSVLQYLNDKECEAALIEFIRVSKENSVVILHIKNRLSFYGLTLCLWKSIARRINYDVIPEYYRPHTYYKNIMAHLGAEIIDSSSSGLFQAFFLPKSIRVFLYRLEINLKDNSYLKKMGVDCWMKFKVVRK